MSLTLKPIDAAMICRGEEVRGSRRATCASAYNARLLSSSRDLNFAIPYVATHNL
jgi:hypothetical protein